MTHTLIHTILIHLILIGKSGLENPAAFAFVAIHLLSPIESREESFVAALLLIRPVSFPFR